MFYEVRRAKFATMNTAIFFNRRAPLYSIHMCRSCLFRYLLGSRTGRASAPPDSPKPPSPSRQLQPASQLPTVEYPRPFLSLKRRREYPGKKGNRGLKPEHFKQYTEEEKAELRKEYTPDQMTAIEAGEAAVDPKDIIQQGLFRTNDPWAIDYEEDFAKIHSVLDKAVRAPESNYDPKSRFKTEEEIKNDFANFVTELPTEPTGVEYQKFIDNYRLMVGKEEAERNPVHYMAPAIPKNIPGLANTARKSAEDIQPALKRLMKQTGFSVPQIRSFRIKNLVQHRVVNQTRMGKIQSIYYLAIAGNQRGLLGIGEGKSAEAEDARQQAHYAAIRNLQPIPRYEQRTIFGDVKGKVGAVELELMHRPPGKQILDWENIHRY